MPARRESVGRDAQGLPPVYTYDAWSRLKTATNAQWGLTYTYDRYGNRKSQSAPVLNNVTPDPYTNRLLDTGYTYDAAGNMTADGLNSLTYDAENHLVTNTQAGVVTNYAYDGNGLRVKKCAPNCSSPTSSTVYIFSGSKVIAEYDNGAAPNSPSREYLYSGLPAVAGGALLATFDATGMKYHHPDHLSPRVSTDSNGTKIAEQGHFPFGESWYETGSTTKWKLTNYDRDAESLNDYAMARYHVNRLARFSSPDPISGDISDPQSLNRYAYSRNDPIDFVDPSGTTFYFASGNCLYKVEADEVTVVMNGESHTQITITSIEPVLCSEAGGGGGGGGYGRGGWLTDWTGRIPDTVNKWQALVERSADAVESEQCHGGKAAVYLRVRDR